MLHNYTDRALPEVSEELGGPEQLEEPAELEEEELEEPPLQLEAEAAEGRHEVLLLTVAGCRWAAGSGQAEERPLGVRLLG